MSIIDNLKKARAAVEADTLNGGNLGFRMRNAAINAIMGGINSAEWKSYMSLFADNAAQLRRLTVPDEQHDPGWLVESRAYIVSNAVCGANTTTQTSQNVRLDIDDGIEEDSDDSVMRPFSIP